jgi:hypothetical protein
VGALISDLYCDGQAILPVLMYCAACPAKELLSCELQAIPQSNDLTGRTPELVQHLCL